MELPKQYNTIGALHAKVNELIRTTPTIAHIQSNELQLQSHLSRSATLREDLTRLLNAHLREQLTARELTAWYLNRIHNIPLTQIKKIIGERGINSTKSIDIRYGIKHKPRPRLFTQIPKFIDSKEEINQCITKLQIPLKTAPIPLRVELKEPKPLPNVDITPYAEIIIRYVKRKQGMFTHLGISVEGMTSIAVIRAKHALKSALDKKIDERDIPNWIKKAITNTIIDEVRGKLVAIKREAKFNAKLAKFEKLNEEENEKLQAHLKGEIPSEALVVWTLSHKHGVPLKTIAQKLNTSLSTLSYLHTQYFGNLSKTKN